MVSLLAAREIRVCALNLMRISRATERSIHGHALDARDSAVLTESVFMASSFCCFQAESTVRYSGGQRKRLGR